MQELHEQGITIITVEHNLKFAARNADKMYHVMNGHGHFCNPQEYVQEYMLDNVEGAELCWNTRLCRMHCWFLC